MSALYIINKSEVILFFILFLILRKINLHKNYWGITNAIIGSIGSLLILFKYNYINLINSLLSFNLAYLLTDIYFIFFWLNGISLIGGVFHHIISIVLLLLYNNNDAFILRLGVGEKNYVLGIMLSLYYNDIFFYLSRIIRNRWTILLNKIIFTINRMIFFNIKAYYIVKSLIKANLAEYYIPIILILLFNFAYFIKLLLNTLP
jgi:hypothetical protein